MEWYEIKMKLNFEPWNSLTANCHLCFKQNLSLFLLFYKNLVKEMKPGGILAQKRLIFSLNITQLKLANTAPQKTHPIFLFKNEN
jgi:hypothetical protein